MSIIARVTAYRHTAPILFALWRYKINNGSYPESKDKLSKNLQWDLYETHDGVRMLEWECLCQLPTAKARGLAE